jgi:4-hydroxybenzoate polyprenyltransferase
MADNNSTLYVDLDGTLINTDLLLESFLRLMNKSIFYLLLIPGWLLKGKANLKHQIAERVDLKIDLLPYNAELLTYLTSQKNNGKHLVLISASSNKYVEQVANHVGLFESSMGSSAFENLKGSIKLDKIREISNQEDFEYAGNDHSDLAIWTEAKGAVVVNGSEKLEGEAAKLTKLITTISTKRDKVGLFVKALRPHQWAKNLLLFLPLILSHELINIELSLAAFASFVSFSFCASSVYLLNDLLDLEHDRQHKTKCKRPFASGELPVIVGIVSFPCLLLLSLLIATQLPIEFSAIVACYFIMTMLYSFRLKAIAVVDVLVLACLYTLRIIAGAAAISVIPSFWLLAFSMFLFMSLAIVKRFTELHNLRYTNKTEAAGRGYQAGDLDLLSMLGSASGFMSVLVFALYINAEETRILYGTPQILWFICPLLLYIICRLWLLAHRGELHEDPVVFAISDRSSQFVTLICGLLVWAATQSWL